MTFFLRAGFFATAAIAACSLTGCFPNRSQGDSNGESGALYFEVENAPYDTYPVVATGFPIEVDVQRFDPQWQSCEFEKSAGTTTPQSCSSLNHEPVTLIDAHCDDDACTVTSTPDGSGTVRLEITGLRDADTKLHVDVKSTSGDSTWGDVFPIGFSTATRIAIEQQGSDTASTPYASMPGASFLWCPELHDASETKLVAPVNAITRSVSGDDTVTFEDSSTQYIPQGCSAFHASTPGASSIVFTAQSLTASGSVKVADPNDIVAAELYEISNDTDTGASASTEIGQDPHLAASPVTAISLSLDDDIYGRDLASVLHMKDGSLALGGAGRYQSSSDETLSIWGEGTDPEIAQGYVHVSTSGNVIGDGTVTATFGAVNVSIPFHISGGASDAGTK